MADNKENIQGYSWHNLANQDLGRILETDPAMGLTEEEAARRLKKGRNVIWTVETTSIRNYTARSLAELTTILLLIAVAVSAFFGGLAVSVAVFVMLLIARIARVITYVFARRVLEKNAQQAIPRARVVRGGNVKEISADKIVVGDVIILDSGDTVPCDIRLTAADSVIVSESGITQAKNVVEKSSNPLSGDDIPIELRSNMLYAGSTVVNGFCVGMAVEVGDGTLTVVKNGTIEMSQSDSIQLFEKLNDVSKYTELGLILFTLIATVVGVLIGSKDIVNVFMPTVSMCAACLGEYILAVLFAVYAVAFRQNEKSESVLRSAADAERLARARVIFVREAGLLRGSKTSVHSYYTKDKFSMMGAAGVKPPLGLLSLACYTTGTTPGGNISKGSYGSKTRQTSVLPYNVIHSLCKEYPQLKKSYSAYQIAAHITAGEENSDGFDASLLFHDNRFYFVLAGRLERVLDRCISQTTERGVLSLDESDKKKIISFADTVRKRGVKIVAVAKRESPYNNLTRLSVLENNLTFEGFIAVSSRIDKEDASFFKSFIDEGGHVVVFSDKNDAATDEYFFRSEGLFKTGDLVCGGRETAPIDRHGFSIISTSQGLEGVKERLKHVKYARDNKLPSLYIGNAVDDMWCMQETGASIAQGTNIPQAIRGSASGMSSTAAGAVKLISRSRRAMSNIGNILTYLISSQMARIVLVIVTSIGAFPMPDPQHMVFWGLLLDFAVCMAIAFNKNKEYASFRERPIKINFENFIYPMLYGTLASVSAIAAPYLGRAVLIGTGKEFLLENKHIMACIFIGCILAMLPIALEYSGSFGLFSNKSRYSRLFIVPAALVVLASILSIVSAKANPGLIMLAFSIIPSAIVVLVMALVRVFTNKNKNKIENNK